MSLNPGSHAPAEQAVPLESNLEKENSQEPKADADKPVSEAKPKKAEKPKEKAAEPESEPESEPSNEASDSAPQEDTKIEKEDTNEKAEESKEKADSEESKKKSDTKSNSDSDGKSDTKESDSDDESTKDKDAEKENEDKSETKSGLKTHDESDNGKAYTFSPRQPRVSVVPVEGKGKVADTIRAIVTEVDQMQDLCESPKHKDNKELLELCGGAEMNEVRADAHALRIVHNQRRKIPLVDSSKSLVVIKKQIARQQTRVFKLAQMARVDIIKSASDKLKTARKVWARANKETRDSITDRELMANTPMANEKAGKSDGNDTEKDLKKMEKGEAEKAIAAAAAAVNGDKKSSESDSESNSATETQTKE
jgi:hypothetical protein